MSRFIQQIFVISLSLEVVENWTNAKDFWPPIFSGGTTPTFLRHFVSATYHPPFDKVWLSSQFRLLISVCEPWQWSGMRNLRRVG